jgi:hypothetical protein
MSKPFSATAMWPLLPVQSWQRHFQCLSLEHQKPIELPWAAIGENTSRLDEEVFKLPRSLLNIVEHDLHGLYALANPHGLETLLKMAEELKFPFTADTLPDGTELARVMEVRLNWPELVQQSVLILKLEESNWWRKRNDLFRNVPDFSEMKIKELETELSKLLKQTQGKGDRSTIQTSRCGDQYYVIAFPDDQVQSIRFHDDGGRLQVHTQRPTFLIVFSMNIRTGELELSAKGSARHKNELEKCFAKVLLQQDLGEWQPLPSYSLLPLTDPTFRPATDPEDDVKVRVKRLRFVDPLSQRQITLQGDEELGESDVYSMIEELFKANAQLLENMKLTLATLTFSHGARPGCRAGRFSVDVVPPYHCSLRNQPTWRIELATKYLRRWRIDVR